MTDPEHEDLVEDAEQQAEFGDGDTDLPATEDGDGEVSLDEESTDFD